MGNPDINMFFWKKTQQAWIKSWDADCAYEIYEFQKGAEFQSIYLQCLLEETNN